MGSMWLLMVRGDDDGAANAKPGIAIHVCKNIYILEAHQVTYSYCTEKSLGEHRLFIW